MGHPELQELEALGLAAARRWPERAGRDSTLTDGISLARCWRLLHWVELFRPVLQFAAEALAPEAGLFELQDSPLRGRVRTSLARQGRQIAEQAALTGAKTYDWHSPLISWSGAKRAVAAALNLREKIGGGRSPRILMASYPSLRPLRDELIRGGAKLVFADFTRDEIGALWSAGAGVFASPRRPRGLAGGIGEVRAAWSEAKAAGDPARLFSWRGASLWEAVEPDLDAWFERDAPALASASAAIVKHWPDPDVVVLASDGDPYQALLAQHAALRKIPTIILQHGLPFGYDFPLEERLPSRMLVWGPEEARRYPAGDDAPRIYAVTGNPAFDRYQSSRPPTSGPIRRLLLLTSPANRISIGASAADPSRYIEALGAAMKGLAGLQVTLKLHPSESEEYYRRACARLGLEWRLEKSRALTDLLSDCDLMIGSFSTALLEAMLSGVPLIPANFSAVPLPAPFDGSFGLKTVDSAAEAGAELRAAIADPETFRRKRLALYGPILDGFAGPRDGRAAKRAALAVLEAARR